MSEPQFYNFVFWALQAILGGAVALLIAVLAWEIKCRLALTREFDGYKNQVTGEYVRTEELGTALSSALQPFLSELQLVRETHRLEREQIKSEMLQMRQTNESERAAFRKLADFVTEVGARLHITSLREHASDAS
jgi:hypothetical protein